MDLSGLRVVVVGLGRSGQAAANWCALAGAQVVATDRCSAAELGELGVRPEVELELGGHGSVKFDEAELIVLSPGVPPLSAVESAARAGAVVMSELELGYRCSQFPLVAIGGTNGKSTTTRLVASLFSAAGLKTFAGGNYGQPLCELLTAIEEKREPEPDIAIVEVSSFQLEQAPLFRPNISVLLNVSEDHLDRYAGFSEYCQAKGNAFVNQLPSDVAIVPADDAICLEQARRGCGRIVDFGEGGEYWVDDDKIVETSSEQSVALEGLPLHGSHNLTNAAAAVAVGRAAGLPWAVIRSGLQSFEPLPHRMAQVAKVDGVQYYNDSKGTNVGAAVTAVLGLPQKQVVLIAGGRDKQGSYEPLVDALRDRGRALITLGEAGPKIERAADGVLPTFPAQNMDHAVALAAKQARAGDAVLLSPACSSFDAYNSYAERGEHFRRAVIAMTEGRTG